MMKSSTLHKHFQEPFCNVMHLFFSFWGTDGRREHYGNAFHCIIALKIRRNTTQCIPFREIITSCFESLLANFFLKNCPPVLAFSVFLYPKSLIYNSVQQPSGFICKRVFSEQLKTWPKVFGQRGTQSHWQLWKISAQRSTRFCCNWRCFISRVASMCICIWI